MSVVRLGPFSTECPDPTQYNKVVDDKPKRNALLMYTGGFDSTLLLAYLTGYKNTAGHSLLNRIAYSKDHRVCGFSPITGDVRFENLPEKYDKVRVLTLEPNCFGQQQSERQTLARSVALAKIEADTGVHIEVLKAYPQFNGANINDGIFQQQAAVYFGAAHLVQTSLESEDLFIGWHFEDCAHTFIETLNRIFRDNANLMGKMKCNLMYPLIETRKISILSESYKLGLHKYCTTCESHHGNFAFGHHCGSCTPCRNLLREVVLMRETAQRQDFLRLFDIKHVTEFLQYLQKDVAVVQEKPAPVSLDEEILHEGCVKATKA